MVLIRWLKILILDNRSWILDIETGSLRVEIELLSSNIKFHPPDSNVYSQKEMV